MEESSVAQRWSIRLLALGFSSLLGGGRRGGGSFFLFVSILIMKGITTLFNVMITDLH